MVHFTGLDLAVFGLYCAGLLALAFSARVRESKIVEYLVAGRNLSLPLFVTTLVCTWYGGILGMGESVSCFGAGTWLLLGVPYYVFGLIYAFKLSSKVRQSSALGIPEQLQMTYGRGVGLGAAVLMFLLAAPSAHILMIGVLIQSFTGWGLGACVGIAGVTGLAMLYRGGILADIRASVLAFVAMYVGFAVLLVQNIQAMPVGDLLSHQKIQPISGITGNQSFATILGFFLLGAWTLIDPGFHQRAASAASPEIGKKGVLVSVLAWMVFDALTISAGLYALVRLPNPPENPLFIFPMLGEIALPPGLKALFFCGMFGTILCAMVGYTLVAGSSGGREVWGLLRSHQVENSVVATRVGMVVAMLLAAFIALQLKSVVSIWYSFGGIVVGALLIPVWTAYRRTEPWVHSAVMMVSMALSVAVSAGLFIVKSAQGDPYVTLKFGDFEFAAGTLVPGLAVSAIVLAIGKLAFSPAQNDKIPS